MPTPVRKRGPEPPSSAKLVDESEAEEPEAKKPKVDQSEPGTGVAEAHNGQGTAADQPAVHKAPPNKGAANLPKLIGGMTQRQAWFQNPPNSRVYCIFKNLGPFGLYPFGSTHHPFEPVDI